MAIEVARKPRMNILILSNKSPFPPNDGSSLAVESMVRGFVDEGLSVCVLSLNTSKHRKSLNDLPADLIGKVRLRLVDVDNRPSPHGALNNLLFSSESYIVSRFRDEDYQKAIENWLEEETFDFVQVEGLSLAHYLSCIRELHFGPIIFRAHNVEHLIWTRSAMYEKWAFKRWYFQIQANRLRKFELDLLPQFDALVPITSIDTGAFKSLGIKVPMKTAFCGLDLEETVQEKYEHSPKFFFVGAFDWLPNLQGVQWLLNDVWPIINKEAPEAELHILGRHAPPEFKYVDGVKVHEDRSVAKGFFKENDILLVPLHSGSGLRIKIVEAMSLGKPTVSTYIGAEGIHGQSGRHFYLEDKATDFAEKALKLYFNKGVREFMGKNARKFAMEHFDRASISKGLISFYQSLR
jgi:glycosyltransferase involved in cell wall biosynthesis